MLSNHVLAQIYAGRAALPELADALGREHRDVVKAVQRLKGRGLVEGVPGAVGHYALTSAGQAWVAEGRVVKPGQGQRPRMRTVGLRERVWWHLFNRGVATLKLLLTTYADGNEKSADTNVYKYLRALERCGIVRRLPNKRPCKQSAGEVQWVIDKRLGPKTPVWRARSRTVFDPNSGAVFPELPTAQEVGDEQG